MSNVKDNVILAIDRYVANKTGIQGSAGVTGSHLLSQLLDSIAFVSLIIALENEFSVTVDDEDFYEAELITVDDLADFIVQQIFNRETRSETADL